MAVLLLLRSNHTNNIIGNNKGGWLRGWVVGHFNKLNKLFIPRKPNNIHGF
jgi:hypothetical protein